MKWLGLVLLGLLGGGGAYLSKNPQVRRTAIVFGKNLGTSGREMIRSRYQGMASRFGLGSRDHTRERIENLGLVAPEEDAGNRPGGPIEPVHS